MPKTAAEKPAQTKTSPYDVAEHLRTPGEMAAYLVAWFEEAPDDATGIARALGDIVRAKQMAKGPRQERAPLGEALSVGTPVLSFVRDHRLATVDRRRPSSDAR